MLLLRDILYDSSGNVKTTRLSALLNAALGYVADEVDGFVDFDAVPEEGASAQVSLRWGTSSQEREARAWTQQVLKTVWCKLRRRLARQQLEQRSCCLDAVTLVIPFGVA